MSTMKAIRENAVVEREMLLEILSQRPRRSSELRVVSKLPRVTVRNHMYFLKNQGKAEKLCEVDMISQIPGGFKKEAVWGIPGACVPDVATLHYTNLDARLLNLPKLTVWQPVEPWSQ